MTSRPPSLYLKRRTAGWTWVGERLGNQIWSYAFGAHKCRNPEKSEPGVGGVKLCCQCTYLHGALWLLPTAPPPEPIQGPAAGKGIVVNTCISMFSGASRSVLFIVLWISAELIHNLDSLNFCAISSLLHNGIWVTTKLSSGCLGVDWGKILPFSGLCGHSPYPFMVLATRNMLWWCRSSLSSNRDLPLLSLVQTQLLAEKSNPVSPKGLHTCCSYALRRSAAPGFQVSDPPLPSRGHVFMSFLFNFYCCCEHDEREWESAHDHVQEPKETSTGQAKPWGCRRTWLWLNVGAGF